MEAVVDTRQYFQATGFSPEWFAAMKLRAIKHRIAMGIWWFGYFDGDELIAFQDAHISEYSLNDLILGMGYTKKGRVDEKWQDSKWPKVSVELLNYAVEYLTDLCNAKSWWAIGPMPVPSAGRVVEVEGGAFMDGSWERSDVGTVKAGTMTGDKFIDTYFLLDRPLPKDQLIMKFDKKDWVDKFAPPPDAPPKGDPNQVPNVHPPLP